MASLDEFRSQLEERARGWTEQWFAEGREEGIEQGRAEGVEQGRAEGVQQGRAEGVQQGRAEGVQQGRAEGVQQGRAEGVQEGRAEGVAAQRATLRRQAALRFGAAAERLDPFLAKVDSLAKLAEISVWVMTDTIDQLAAKVEAAAAGDHAH